MGDTLALGAELAGADKATIEKWRGYGQNAQAIGELFLPGGGVVKAAGMAGKAAMGAERGGRIADTMINGGRASKVLRNTSDMLAGKIGAAASNRTARTSVGRSSSDFVQSFCGGIISKNNPIESISGAINRNRWFSDRGLTVSTSYAEGVSKRFDAIGEVKDSKDAVTTLYDSATGESRKPEEERGYNNALSNAWHSCFG